MALQLGQVEVGTRALGDRRLGVVERVERQVEDPRRDRLAVHEDVLLLHVPAARAHQQRGQVVAEAVLLAPAAERDRPVHRVAQVDLPLDGVLPGGRVGVLEVGHEHLRARVERVDDHLAVDRAGDLGATILQVGRRGGDLPRRVVPDLSGLGEEVRYRTGVERGGPLHPQREQLAAAGLEGPVQLGHERERVGREDLRLVGGDLGGDLDSVRESDGAHGSRDTFLDASSSRAGAPAPRGAAASVVERRCRPGPERAPETIRPSPPAKPQAPPGTWAARIEAMRTITSESASSVPAVRRTRRRVGVLGRDTRRSAATIRRL